jgi:hypothetical protein
MLSLPFSLFFDIATVLGLRRSGGERKGEGRDAHGSSHMKLPNAVFIICLVYIGHRTRLIKSGRVTNDGHRGTECLRCCGIAATWCGECGSARAVEKRVRRWW